MINTYLPTDLPEQATIVTTSHSLPLLDAEGVMRAMNDTGEIYCEVAAVFLEDVPAMLAALALSSVSAGQLVSVLHEVANSLGVIGAQRGESAVRALEVRLRDGESLALLPVAEQAKAALQSTRIALEAWLAEH